MSYPPAAPSSPVVTFVAADFRSQFPEFAPLGDGMLTAYFVVASTLFANSQQNLCGVAGGQVPVLTQMLYFATAHVAWLTCPKDLNGNPSASANPVQPPSSIVGRVNSASEGSVSVGSEWKGTNNPDEAYWVQTQYGATFWTMTSPARTFAPAMTQGTSAMRAGILPPYPFAGRGW